MISTQKIKNITKKEKMRISKKAIEKLFNILEEKSKEIIRKATRKAEFSGRVIIKETDIDNS